MRGDNIDGCHVMPRGSTVLRLASATPSTSTSTSTSISTSISTTTTFTIGNVTAGSAQQTPGGAGAGSDVRQQHRDLTTRAES
ncbi:unnamed protein product [Gadus morhua 'NCC']